jgi:hypothetical protein
LRLPLENEELGGRLFCPGCSTDFQFDESTGVFTIFTDDQPRSLDEEDVSRDHHRPEGAADKSEEDAAGFVEKAAEEQRSTEGRERYAFLFFFTVLALGLIVGGVLAAFASSGQRMSTFIKATVFAAALGCVIPAIILRVLQYRDAAQHVGRRVFRLGPKEPDFDEIADRLNEGMIRRRPLSSSDKVKPQSDGLQPNESNNNISDDKLASGRKEEPPDVPTESGE